MAIRNEVKGLEKKRVTVFDYKAEDCAATAAAVREYVRREDTPAEVAEFTALQPFIYNFKDNRDAGTPYDMAFIGVDTMMGAEVARHVRDLDIWCPIFMSSEVSDFAMEGYRLHALDYFSKPASVTKVKNAVRRI